ncbi:MAG: ion channel [Burkholderiales bacterium]
MQESLVIAQAAQPSSIGQTLTQDAAGIARVPGDIAQLPFFQHLAEAMPAADVAFGGGMLMLIILVHATGVRAVTGTFARRLRVVTLRPSVLQADLLMAMAIMLLLVLHLVEVILWASSLVYSGLVPSWRAAGFFAGNTYTTVGYGAFVLPTNWEMLAPIIAISGLFTFGWSGSVLVDIVARCQRIKDMVADRDIKRKSAQAQP